MAPRIKYAAVGCASRAALAETVTALRSAEAGDLLSRFSQKAEDAAAFTDAYRRYCWPVGGVADHVHLLVRITPTITVEERRYHS